MDWYRFEVGGLECTAIYDGPMSYTADQYVANAPVDEVAPALEAHGHRPDDIPSPYSGLVVRTGDRLVLIDTGGGDLTPDVGRLGMNLERAGFAPHDVDTVLITHAHPDHIGGNVDAAGDAAFPNARYVMWRDEWDYWTDEANLTRLPGVFGESVHKNLSPLRDRFELLTRDTEIAPGIEAIRAVGHTAGHIAVAVGAGEDELLYVSDAAIHPIHLEHPDWHPIWDLDAAEASATKRRLFDRAVDGHSLVLAFHFPPFPSLGHVEKHGAGWRWRAVDPTW